VGELALIGGRVGAQLRDCHNQTERAVRGVARPDAVVLGPMLAVSARVGNVKNNHPKLIDPISAAQ
jgi:hypothetical protein